MEMYKVHVATGSSEYSGTNNYVYVTLVGERGESERTLLDNPGMDFCRGAVDEYVVRSARPLGELLLVRLEKQRYWVEDNWFCRYVRVEPPGGSTEPPGEGSTEPPGGSTEPPGGSTEPPGGSTEPPGGSTEPPGGSTEPPGGSTEPPPGGARALTFPCYRWLIGDVTLELREGTAQRWCDDTLPLLREHRKSELQQRQNIYRWLQWAPGIPKCIDASSEADLHQDVRFDNEKRSDFEGSLHYALIELSLKKFAIRFGKSWDDLDDFKRIFWKLRSPIAEYVMDHWKEDWFFGYQCLNGCNPRMIHRIHRIPHNFPVTADMVQGSLDPRTTLHRELSAGNVYLVDYAIMDGITANVIRGKPQHIAAPLCLLYQHPDEGLVPIAIQLGQTPGLATPIFLPRDPPLAWLLAKMWVRHAEFQVFQVLSHLLRTHLVVEVFCVATLRQLPAVHPVYKLLAPHLRYTLEINCRGRTQLISSDGIFKRVVSTGGEGLVQLSQREYRVLKYTSLQPRHDFTERGVDRLPKYYYREHSLMLWDAIYSFVSGMVEVYYATDREVFEDPELQAWITDVTKEGFSDIPHFGLSGELDNRKELSTLLSVVIFCSTAQHAATNNGQFDWCAWVPNTPCTMRHAPPDDKDAVTMAMIMDTLPDVSQSCLQMAITWHLGRVQPGAVPLGQYTEQYFTEQRSQEVIERFRAELKDIEDRIVKQSEGEALKYHFLLPSNVENSITI